MSTPVISAAAAQHLNKKVQQLIDPRLFLCCNYEPTLSVTISAEGQYLIAIQDLYKFALDSSCIIKNYNKFLYTKQEQIRFKELRNILDCINMLRSVTDHNQSELNGWTAKKRLDNYSIWIQDCLGKDEPETLEDFSHLHKHLCEMAKKLLRYLGQFIEYLGHLPDSTELVSKWIDSTLQWYCNNTKTEIYIGQLMDAYIANANANGKNYSQLYRSHILYWKINNWVEAAIFHTIDQKLESIRSEIRSAKLVLNEEAPLVRELRAKMPDEQFKSLQTTLQSKIEENECHQRSLQKQRENLAEEISGQPMNYFFRGLEQRLRNTMSYLEDKGISYTLLPQDLLQEDITLYFGAVHSPEEDF